MHILYTEKADRQGQATYHRLYATPDYGRAKARFHQLRQVGFILYWCWADSWHSDDIATANYYGERFTV